MRVIFFSLLSIFFFQTSFASAVSPAAVGPSLLIPDTNKVVSNTLSAPSPHSKTLYTKGRGTIGLIAGITLGPIGLLGAHLFSHNRAVRKKAALGCEIWVALAVLTGIVLLAAASGGHGSSGGHSSPNFDFSGFSSGHGGNQDPHKKKKKREPEPAKG